MRFEEDRIYAQYFRDVSAARMPENASEEQALFERYHQHGDLEAKRRLVEGNLRFVIKTAKQYYRGDTEFLKNLIAAGNVGLMVAVDRYRPWVIKCRRCGKQNFVAAPKHQRCTECNARLRQFDAERYTTRFLTYAAWWISEAIRTELYESSLVHIPPYKQKEHHRARQQGHTVGLTYVSFEDAAEQAEAVIGNHEHEALEQHALSLLHSILRSMKDRQAYVVIAYFGLREDPKTLREIAQKLGVCSERVRQIKEEALQELKTRLLRLNVRNSSDVLVN